MWEYTVTGETARAALSESEVKALRNNSILIAKLENKLHSLPFFLIFCYFHHPRVTTFQISLRSFSFLLTSKALSLFLSLSLLLYNGYHSPKPNQRKKIPIHIDPLSPTPLLRIPHLHQHQIKSLPSLHYFHHLHLHRHDSSSILASIVSASASAKRRRLCRCRGDQRGSEFPSY